MNDSEMQQKLEEYEGLVIATTRYWRHCITYDLADEDIQQELRMKVWRALLVFDPSRGYPEKNHVFGAVRNRIKDLIGKKRREKVEVLVSTFEPSSDFHESNNFFSGKLHKGHAKDYASIDDEKSDILFGLDEIDQWIGILMAQGYNAPEISREMGITVSAVRTGIARVREHVSSLLDERVQSSRTPDADQ